MQLFSARVDSQLSLLTVEEFGTNRSVSELERCTRLRSLNSGLIKQFNSSSITENIDSVQRSCSTAGHLLFFMDDNQGVLAKVTLLPINKHNLMVPAPLSTLQDQMFYSAFVDQESSTIVTDFVSPLVLLRGLTSPRSISVDQASRYITECLCMIVTKLFSQFDVFDSGGWIGTQTEL